MKKKKKYIKLKKPSDSYKVINEMVSAMSGPLNKIGNRYEPKVRVFLWGRAIQSLFLRHFQIGLYKQSELILLEREQAANLNKEPG